MIKKSELFFHVKVEIEASARHGPIEKPMDKMQMEHLNILLKIQAEEFRRKIEGFLESYDPYPTQEIKTEKILNAR